MPRRSTMTPEATRYLKTDDGITSPSERCRSRRRDTASTMKEHHKCSTSRDYTHTVYPTFPPGSELEEQRKEDGFGSRFQQHNDVHMVQKSSTQCKLQTRGAFSKAGEREREIEGTCLK